MAIRMTLLQRPLDNSTYYLLSFAIALCYTFSLFPLDFFTGTNPFWFDIRTDPTQHVTGLWAFLADEWHFPLLYTTYLNYPEGVSAAYADIIPLAALLFKPIASFFPDHSHYFGVWVLLSYLLQGIAGAYFLGNAVGKNLLMVLTGTLFAVMMPALMIRIPHAALLTQSLLIFALAFYYLAWVGKLTPAQGTRRQGMLILLAALIHPYFLAMLYPVYIVTHLSLAVKYKEKISYAFWEGMTVTVLVLTILWITGYIIPDQGVFRPAQGFDINSMNLLSPLLGTHLAGSVFLPSGMFKLDATGLQIDGHNYLGISLLLMLFFLAAFKTKELLKALFSHWLMVLLMIGFTLYALSNKIYMADTLIFSYDLPHIFDKITGTFRSSGRFFWPVGYALLFGALILCIRSCRQKLLLPVLPMLILLQYIDTAPHRDYLYEASHRKPYFKVEHDPWNRLVASAKNVYLFPTYGCGADYIDPLAMQYFTTFNKKPYNTGFVARAQTDCSLKNAVLEKRKRPGDLFIFSKGKISDERIASYMGSDFHKYCRRHTIGVVCKIGADAKAWQQFSDANFSIITSLKPN